MYLSLKTLTCLQALGRTTLNKKRDFLCSLAFQAANILNIYVDSSPFLEMTLITCPEKDILWILKQAVVLVKDGGTGVFFLLESGTVESHCSEGGVSDVTAARHTKDL